MSMHPPIPLIWKLLAILPACGGALVMVVGTYFIGDKHGGGDFGRIKGGALEFTFFAALLAPLFAAIVYSKVVGPMSFWRAFDYAIFGWAISMVTLIAGFIVCCLSGLMMVPLA